MNFICETVIKTIVGMGMGMSMSMPLIDNYSGLSGISSCPFPQSISTLICEWKFKAFATILPSTTTISLWNALAIGEMEVG